MKVSLGGSSVRAPWGAREQFLRLVYTKRQRQHCENSMMMQVILFSLKPMVSLHNWVATHFQVTPLFSMKTLVLASLQSCHCIYTDVMCKWAHSIPLLVSANKFSYRRQGLSIRTTSECPPPHSTCIHRMTKYHL